MSDATILLRDMAGDAATNAAARVKPSHEDLDQIDRPAQDNTWHDTPQFNKAALKDMAQGVYKGNPKEDAKAAATQGTSTAHPSGSSNPQDLAGAPSGLDAQAGAYSAANTLQQKVDENVDDETKEKARAKKEEYRARAKEYLRKKMPQERRDQTIWRLKVGSTALQKYFVRLSNALAENGS